MSRPVWRTVCTSDALVEGGDGVRLEARVQGGVEPAFVVRFDGQVHAYLNQCRHIPVELDWQPGRFFDESGLYLTCSVHGALYDAQSGLCVSGPCRGRSLRPLRAREHEGSVQVEFESDEE